ncbi:probable tRNA (guanine(26)-N(2))-dimethyltransferase isoform X2 [Portunus trituberculatus]|uniref:probable tRNA (guanine(26)-N(2))-dimethyltransferase isoform X2 n=1 Tax=Portunus trituberculatus TaxID=210409 RepID=UPI001E1D1E4E|nr:probable tRNA (guanine(26)-N(2))-dimethyltransferase isoform X2 [Portunus trituberculatus]
MRNHTLLQTMLRKHQQLRGGRRMATETQAGNGGGGVRETGTTGEGEGEVGFVVDTQPYTVVTEGKAEVLFPASHDVFYNPVQEFNRDLSVAVLRVFAVEHKKVERERKEKEKVKERRKQEYLKKLASSQDSKIETRTAENGNAESDKTASEVKNDLNTEKIEKDTIEGNTDTQGVDESGEDEDKNIIIGNTSGKGKEAKNEKKIDLPPPGTKDEEGISILEGLAASGLRSIRYAREVAGVKEVVANDISKQALECMRRNIEHNKVAHLVRPSHNDASMVMYENRAREKRFHAIDLDPYGSPHIFLDGAVQSVAEGGILLVTCTDMAVLCGNSPETCYAKYGALSLKSKACHEMALRIVLQCLESHANRYSRYIVPLLSLSADFYVRVVVRVFSSKAKVQESFTKVSWVYQCVGCETVTMQPLGRILTNKKSIKHQVSQGPPVAESCSHCGHRHVVGGPVWSAPIHDREFLSSLKESLVEEDFTTYRRMLGVISMMEEELPDVPLYYVLDRLARVASINLCKMVQFRSALLNAGYRVSLSHADPASLKTNAPARVVWDVVRAWERQQPARKTPLPADHPARFILQQDMGTEVNFDLHPNANPESRKKELLRFQVKPEKFWGPKSRAKTSLLHGTLEEKRTRNQGKKRRQPSPQPSAVTKQPREQSPPKVPQQDQQVV